MGIINHHALIDFIKRVPGVWRANHVVCLTAHYKIDLKILIKSTYSETNMESEWPLVGIQSLSSHKVPGTAKEARNNSRRQSISLNSCTKWSERILWGTPATPVICHTHDPPPDDPPRDPYYSCHLSHTWPPMILRGTPATPVICHIHGLRWSSEGPLLLLSSVTYMAPRWSSEGPLLLLSSVTHMAPDEPPRDPCYSCHLSHTWPPDDPPRDPCYSCHLSHTWPPMNLRGTPATPVICHTHGPRWSSERPLLLLSSATHMAYDEPPRDPCYSCHLSHTWPPMILRGTPATPVICHTHGLRWSSEGPLLRLSTATQMAHDDPPKDPCYSCHLPHT